MAEDRMALAGHALAMIATGHPDLPRPAMVSAFFNRPSDGRPDPDWQLRFHMRTVADVGAWAASRGAEPVVRELGRQLITEWSGIVYDAPIQVFCIGILREPTNG